jgi:hypothetical protein
VKKLSAEHEPGEMLQFTTRREDRDTIVESTVPRLQIAGLIVIE